MEDLPPIIGRRMGTNHQGTMQTVTLPKSEEDLYHRLLVMVTSGMDRPLVPVLRLTSDGTHLPAPWRPRATDKLAAYPDIAAYPDVADLRVS